MLICSYLDVSTFEKLRVDHLHFGSSAGSRNENSKTNFLCTFQSFNIVDDIFAVSSQHFLMSPAKVSFWCPGAIYFLRAPTIGQKHIKNGSLKTVFFSHVSNASSWEVSNRKLQNSPEAPEANTLLAWSLSCVPRHLTRQLS